MGSPDAGQRFLELLSLMARLRGDGGCPWDREQTRESLRPFLVEETHEVLEALEAGDPVKIQEELGDLLFQVVFHAEIARERAEFSITDVLAMLVDKMVRRHPHVFGDSVVGTAAEALAQWESIKQIEGDAPRRSALAGIPRSLPGLLRAQRIQHRASRVGFDWRDPVDALDKVREEVAEVSAALAAGIPARLAAEIGDLFFSVVNVARLAGTDPEAALQGAVARFDARFRLMEQAADDEARDLRSLTLDEMERLWVAAKSQESRV